MIKTLYFDKNSSVLWDFISVMIFHQFDRRQAICWNFIMLMILSHHDENSILAWKLNVLMKTPCFDENYSIWRKFIVLLKIHWLMEIQVIIAMNYHDCDENQSVRLKLKIMGGVKMRIKAISAQLRLKLGLILAIHWSKGEVQKEKDSLLIIMLLLM